MRLGTKSLLFGVHAVWFHGLLVALAWRKVYNRWPRYTEFMSCLLHDIGLWGCKTMDGPSGMYHPWFTAMKIRDHWIFRILLSEEQRRDVIDLVVNHSRRFCRVMNTDLSMLALPDKYSLAMDPPWFYLLRARLSGEINEYREDAAVTGYLPRHCTDRLWLELVRQDRFDMIRSGDPMFFSTYYDSGKAPCPCREAMKPKREADRDDYGR